MAGDLTDDAWQELYDGIERVLPVRDTSTTRAAPASSDGRRPTSASTRPRLA